MANYGTFNSAALPDGSEYYVLLPDNYTPTQQYPVLLFLHGGGQEGNVPSLTSPWFNTPAFRSAYPAIVVEPVLAGASVSVTWGGFYGDTAANTPGENDALAAVAQVMSQYSADPNRVYVTGLSLGGYGSWDLMIKYNAYDGTQGRIFAAGMPLAGGEASSPNLTTAAIVAELQNVPIWAIDSGGDADMGWDVAMASALGTSGAYHYTQQGGGEDVWDSTYPMPFGTPYYSWLFSQSASVAGGGTLAVQDTTTGSSLTPLIEAYSGPVAGLQDACIIITSDSLNISASTPNWFIHTGSGNDAIAVSSGTNVVDGGTGSNFLTSGSGTDTFFIDDRTPAADIWSTVNNFHVGDSVTIWGITPQDFALTWADGQGAGGFTGLTLHVTAADRPTASLTLVGFSQADLSSGRVSVSFGTVGGSDYMYVHANS